MNQDRYPENQLEYKILHFRTGFNGITNRFCKSWDEKNNCLNYEVKEYDLKSADVRSTLNQLAFICKMGGKRYKIDRDSARLRRDMKYKCGFLHFKTCTDSEYVDVESGRLRELNVKCFSANKYPFDQQ